MTAILFVCHGNICRSPMAESVFTHLAQERGVSGRFTVRSAATSAEELGNPVHYGTVQMLRKKGIPCIPHRAVRLRRADYEEYDCIIGMDGMNRRGILRILGADPEGKVYSLLDFTDEPRDIDDPWYTGDFESTFRDIYRGCTALLDKLTKGGAK